VVNVALCCEKMSQRGELGGLIIVTSIPHMCLTHAYSRSGRWLLKFLPNLFGIKLFH